MTFLFFYVMYIFKFGIIPMWLICLVGRPLFLLKMIKNLFHMKIQNHEIFNLFLCFNLLFVFYYSFISYQAKKDIKLEKESLSIESKSLTARSSERNIYIFINSIAMLITIHKLTERHIRLDDLKTELKKKQEELDKLVPQKSAEDKKND